MSVQAYLRSAEAMAELTNARETALREIGT